MFKELSSKEKERYNKKYREMLKSYEFGLLATLYNCQKEGFGPFVEKLRNNK